MEVGEEVARKRIARFLRRQVKVRMHGAAIIFASCLVAWLCAWAMLRVGLVSMPLRYFVTVIVGYATFLLLVKFWVRLWNTSTYFTVVSRELQSRARTPRDQNLQQYSGDDSAMQDWSSLGMAGDIYLFAIVCLSLIIFVVFFSTITYGMFSAEVYFSDIVFETLVTAGLIVSVKRRGTGDWENTAVRSSLPRVIALLVAAEAFALIATSAYPEAKTVGDVMRLYIARH